ncbi:MAG: hypothetical protein U0Q47_13215 [Mycobacterium sp.]
MQEATWQRGGLPTDLTISTSKLKPTSLTGQVGVGCCRRRKLGAAEMSGESRWRNALDGVGLIAIGAVATLGALLHRQPRAD